MKRYLEYLPYLAWIIVLVSTLGSLVFSEVLKFTPCVLCWYQRICMYPLVILLAVGIIRKDRGAPYYILPLALSGLLISFYQNLLYYNIIPEVYAPCTIGVSCTTRYISWLGFISIPLLSLLGFLAVTISLGLYLGYNSKVKSDSKKK